jgi:hypothetical protein
MQVLHTMEKGRMLNIIENFYIYRETAANNQLNDSMTSPPISYLTQFYVMYRPVTLHSQPLSLSPTTSSIYYGTNASIPVIQIQPNSTTPSGTNTISAYHVYTVNSKISHAPSGIRLIPPFYVRNTTEATT